MMMNVKIRPLLYNVEYNDNSYKLKSIIVSVAIEKNHKIFEIINSMSVDIYKSLTENNEEQEEKECFQIGDYIKIKEVGDKLDNLEGQIFDIINNCGEKEYFIDIQSIDNLYFTAFHDELIPLEKNTEDGNN